MKTLVWYRNDLRVTDHEPLTVASQTGSVLAVYCIDPRHFEDTSFGFPKTGAHRAKFLTECLKNLRENLKKRGGELVIRSGKPELIIPEMVAKYGVDRLIAHKEVTREEADVEKTLEKSLQIPVQWFHGHTMYHPDDLPMDGDNIPNVFTDFRKKVEKYSRVREPILAPDKMISVVGVEPGEIPDMETLFVDTPLSDTRSVLQFKGGEDEGLERINQYFFKTDSLKEYKFTRNGLLGADYSSKFSPWLAHGCISARTIHSEVKRYEKERHKNECTYWMIFELIWRDYFRFSAQKHGNRIFYPGGIQDKAMDKSTDRALFDAWAFGQTGIPFIDANMRELNATGFMSNRGRQNVASFLAQNLNLDWRMGAEYFESRLLDYDVCSNWGNWAYNATVGHDPRNRYFNIISQAQNYDSKGEYVRHWLPELKHVPKEFIFEPHRMSPDQQNLFEAVIGEDYPAPMIDLEASYEDIRSRD